jgi:transaldolase
MSVTPVNERLAALTAAGTSVWLDQLRRGMIESGELERMVVEESLRGVTSNPAIFEKAILGSPDYDDDLAEGAREGLSAREVYRRLAVRDVQMAADVLRPVYDETGGVDGYVSLEVAPRLAHDTEGTLEQARLYWGLVDRPNVMIKIPATDAGVPAIEQALYEGLNINITLLFAVAAYEQVMEAYIVAMERRQAEGLSLDRHSVASFFV